MKVDQRKKVSSFQSDFKAEFGVGIRVYKGVKLADDVAIKSLTAKGSPGGDINFGGNTKVKNVEKVFKDEMGIKVQVENKAGGLADNDATLASLLK
jgi:hypothetical protein